MKWNQAAKRRLTSQGSERVFDEGAVSYGPQKSDLRENVRGVGHDRERAGERQPGQPHKQIRCAPILRHRYLPSLNNEMSADRGRRQWNS